MKNARNRLSIRII